MSDSLLKQIEFSLRRLVVRVLRLLIYRHQQHPSSQNYNSKKVLFIRQDRIGDVLISTPIFSLLKKYYPNITLDILLSSNNHFVLDNNPSINRKWIYKKSIFNVIQILKSIRNEKYDYLIDMMDNPSTTSTIFCALAGAQWNIGLAKENDFVYDIKVPLLSRQNVHIIHRIAQLIIPFGINPDSEKLQVQYYISQESENIVEQYLTLHKLNLRNIIGINISAGSNTRYWGVENYRSLIKYINIHHPESSPLILYQPADIKIAEEICESLNNVFISQVTNSFDLFAAYIKRLNCLISPDTSAIHLASAFGVPCVVMYVQSNKNLRIWEPYGIDFETIVTDVDNLSTISIDNVTSAFDKLINRIRN